MLNTFESHTPTDVQTYLGQLSDPDAAELLDALLVMCDLIKERQRETKSLLKSLSEMEARIATLEKSQAERQAKEWLASFDHDERSYIAKQQTERPGG